MVNFHGRAWRCIVKLLVYFRKQPGNRLQWNSCLHAEKNKMDNIETQHMVSELLLSVRARRLQFPVFANDIHWEIALFVIESFNLGKTIDISGLAHITGKSRNTIFAQVGLMEKEGHLLTMIDDHDQRRKIVLPTEILKTEFERFAKAIAPDITKASYKIQQAGTR